LSAELNESVFRLEAAADGPCSDRWTYCNDRQLNLMNLYSDWRHQQPVLVLIGGRPGNDRQLNLAPAEAVGSSTHCDIPLPQLPRYRPVNILVHQRSQ
jgi:hypothetical protein